jgi:hypothetical protein
MRLPLAPAGALRLCLDVRLSLNLFPSRGSASRFSDWLFRAVIGQLRPTDSTCAVGCPTHFGGRQPEPSKGQSLRPTLPELESTANQGLTRATPTDFIVSTHGKAWQRPRPTSHALVAELGDKLVASAPSCKARSALGLWQSRIGGQHSR